MLNNNPFKLDGFLTYPVRLTIAPAPFAAAIYLTLSRIVVVYDENISDFKPRTYIITFIPFNVIALILQAAGGPMASTAEPGDQEATDLGVNVIIAGLAWQVVSLCIFQQWQRTSTSGALRSARYFRASLWVFGIATLLIVVRSVYRCAELREGFQGHLADDEASFMVLEATMIALAVFALTGFIMVLRGWGVE
ncbi:RTA1 domain-containing protein [Aspergillus mulundensis]|uniref:Uncharacterized protein n=1 Tax=Aspergillus mulundensis TaxID=1810919 RepID=A0A3D8T390_9EURO|nr:hypothetical protein DSM5745_00349 [Aspergillus mulundensis]RDW93027.1 hypothetical protein DSM5745_00349 [Aspergillus mulundensis]